MQRIDFEHHFFSPGTLDFLSARKEVVRYDPSTTEVILQEGSGAGNDRLSLRLDKLHFDITDLSERRIALMDACGIDTALLSTDALPAILPGGQAVELCKEINDTAFQATRRFPGRFLGTAALPVGDVRAAVDELSRCSQELGFPVWHVHSNFGPNGHLDDPAYRPLLAQAAKLGMAVYLHPNLPTERRYLDSGFAFAGPGLGFTVDSLTTALKLIVSGAFDELPGLTVIMGHLGETFPFLLERMDNRFGYFKDPQTGKGRQISRYFKDRRILVTTSGNMSRAAFACAKEVLGIEGILYATDFPYEDPQEVAAFAETLGLTDEEKAKLFAGNAERLVLNKGR